jgi:hypothetical protein
MPKTAASDGSLNKRRRSVDVKNLKSDRILHLANLSAIVVVRILSETRADRTNRVHRMDAGWASEAFKVCRTERR